MVVVVRSVERAARHTFERLQRMCMTGRRAVMQDQRPRQCGRRQCALLWICCRTRKVDGIAHPPRESRLRCVDARHGRSVGRRTCSNNNRIAYVRRTVVVGNSQAGAVCPSDRVGERRLHGRGVVERAVSIEIPGVDERVAHIRIVRARPTETHRQRRRTEVGVPVATAVGVWLPLVNVTRLIVPPSKST